MMQKVKIGIIGCGNMTQSHIKGILEIDDRVAVCAVCDIDIERAKKAADSLGAGIVSQDYRDIAGHVDAVLIALPHDLHYEVGLFFLENGVHVLMEKPLCNSEDECVRLIEMAEKVDKVLMTAYPVRYWPVVQKMKELVDSHVYGDVFQMSIWTEQFTKYPAGHWANSAKRLGGGQLFSHGCHSIDLLLWFLGDPVIGTHIGTNFGTPWMEKEGTSNAIIKFESGAMGYHFGTWGARGTRLGYSFHIHCTKGMLEYNNTDQKLYFHSNIADEKGNMNTASVKEVIMVETDPSKKTQYEFLHFLDCVLTGKKPLTDGPSSLRSLRVIWRMYEAEKNNVIADLRGLD
jgi:predicted dehydrogenase